jgi:hypothetical protein
VGGFGREGAREGGEAVLVEQLWSRRVVRVETAQEEEGNEEKEEERRSLIVVG